MLHIDDTSNLDPERIYEAIRSGVYDAIWQMITNNTDMPCADFFGTIKEAAKEALGDLTQETEKK